MLASMDEREQYRERQFEITQKEYNDRNVEIRACRNEERSVGYFDSTVHLYRSNSTNDYNICFLFRKSILQNLLF